MPEQTRYRRRHPAGELKALAAAIVALLLVLAGAWWLTQRRPAAPPKESRRVPRPDNRVIVEVNGEPIYESEFSAAIASLPPQMREQLSNEYAKREVGEELVKMKLLEQQARRMGLDEDPEIRGRLDMMQANALATAALQQMMRNAGPPKLEELYQQNKSRFESVRVKAILIPYEGAQAKPRSGRALPLAQAQAKAQRIVRQLRSGGNFAALARAESAGDPAGEFGEINRGTFPPDIDQALFNLKVGEISDPLKSPFGLHIFKVEQKKARSFEQMKSILESQARNLQASTIIEELRRQAKVEFKRPFFGG